MNAARKILSNIWFIHSMVLLGLLALWGYIESDNKYILFGVVLSFSGAMCGSFIRVTDAIKSKR